MGAGYFYLSKERLREALYLPIEAVILNVDTDTELAGKLDAVIVHVSHPDIAGYVSWLNPTFEKREPVVFKGWGQ